MLSKVKGIAQDAQPQRLSKNSEPYSPHEDLWL